MSSSKLPLASALAVLVGCGVELNDQACATNADGTLCATVVVAPVGRFPIMLTAADFNGDGVQDIISSNAVELSLLLGNGDGTFADAISIETTGSPIEAVQGDFNRDGAPDLALVEFIELDDTALHRGVVLQNNGDGTFTEQAPFFEDPEQRIQVPRVFDSNGDGADDIALNGLLGVDIILNDGTGTLTPLAEIVASTNEPVAADFTGDQLIDLHDGRTLFAGQGDGTFVRQDQLPAVDDNASTTFAVDLNQDGAVDLALTETVLELEGDVFTIREGLVVALNQGDGNFDAPVRLLELSEDLNLANVSAADVNGDGRPDVVVPNNDGEDEILVFLQREDGSFTAPFSFFAGVGAFYIANRDLSGDGIPDISFNSAGTNEVRALLFQEQE